MTPLQQLAEHGQSVWIDYLSRRFVKDGDLKGLVEQGVVGVTSNPTIFQGAIAEGDAYDDQIRELSAEYDDPKEIFWQLAKDDIRDACDILRPVYDEGEGKDGWVSLEVDPNLAHDTEKTKSEAIRLHALVDRPNLFIKIPATLEGLQAIEDTIAAGIPVNVTLIFSLERHRKVAEAYVRGVQRFVDGGGDPQARSRPSPPSSSRASTPRPTSAWTRSAATTSSRASSRSPTPSSPTRPTRRSSRRRSGRRWRPRARPSSAACGRRPATRTRTTRTRSTSRSSSARTRSTRCRASWSRRSLDHGEIRGDTLLEDAEEASRILDAFEAAGVSYDDVVQTLEREGVEKFAKSFADLIEGLESKLKLVAA